MNKGARARVLTTGLGCCAAVAALGCGMASAQKPVSGSAAVGPDQAPQASDPAQDPNFDAALPPLDRVQAPPAAPTKIGRAHV